MDRHIYITLPPLPFVVYGSQRLLGGMMLPTLTLEVERSCRMRDMGRVM